MESLLTNLLNFFIFIFVIALLVFVHELGHFWAAKALGVRVKEFALGFGKKIISKKYKGTEYKLNLIPLGGYVSLEGEQIDQGESKPTKDSFQSQPLWGKVVILIAGIAMNILFAIVLMAAYIATSGYTVRINYAAPFTFLGAEKVVLSQAIYLSEIIDGTAAAQAGIADNDVILKLNGEDVLSEQQFREFLEVNQGVEVVLDIFTAESENKSVNITLGERGSNDTPVLGAKYQMINFQYIIDYPDTIIAAVPHVWNIFAYQIEVLSSGFRLAFERGDASYAADQASSIVAVGVIVGRLVDSGQLDEVVNLTALISISLAFFNLLPIPLLDGGQIVIYSLKAVLGRKFNNKIIEVLNIISFAILVLLSVALIVRDFIRFEVFSSFFN